MSLIKKVIDEALGIFEAEISPPNIPLQVNDEGELWITLATYDDLKLQQNTLGRSARIVKKEGKKSIRIAWGTMNAMEKAFRRMVDLKKLS